MQMSMVFIQKDSDIDSRSAVLSDCGKYRYRLERTWSTEGPRVLFVMVNPSTADAIKDDRTICKCRTFARGWGYASLEVANLFAFRATDPKACIAAGRAAIGKDNDRYIVDAASRANLIIAAWGAHGNHQGRDKTVLNLLKEYAVHCLHKTAEGHPGHPLYLKGDLKPVLFKAAGATQ